MVDAPYQTFGWIYLALGAAAVVAAMAVRWAIAAGGPPGGSHEPDVFQLAWLVGGRRRVLAAALAGLAQRGSVEREPSRWRRRLVAGRPGGT